MSQYILPFKHGQKIVELGGGDKPLFHPNVDNEPGLSNVDIVADLEELFPLEDEEFEGVYSHFCMEHIQWRKVPNFINEVFRILKPGGLAVIITNNLFAQAKEIVKRDKVEIEECCMIFGGQSRGGDFHKSGFSPGFTMEMFRAAGFGDIKINPLPTQGGHTDMVIEARKPDIASNVVEAVMATPAKEDTGSFPENIKNSKWYKDLWKQESTYKDELKLNIGSFTVMIRRYVNIDLLDLYDFSEEQGFLFKQLDVRKGLPYLNGSVDFINTSHLIEHLTVKEGEAFLKECLRVLKPQCKVRLGTPDLAKLIEYYHHKRMGEFDKHQPDEYKSAPSQADKFWRILTPGHKTIYDEPTLVDLLVKAGFMGSLNVAYNKETDMFPDHSIYMEGTKPQSPIPEEKTTYTTHRKDPLKVGVISTPFFGVPPAKYSGLERIVFDLCEGLSDLGVEVTLIAPNGSYTPRNGHLIEAGKPANAVQVNWLDLETQNYEAYKDKVGDLDILHEHSWFGLAYKYKSLHPETKVCHTHHGGLNLEFWKKSTPPFKLNMIAISDWMAKMYGSQGFNAKRVYNGIDIKLPKAKKSKGDRLLFVGRLDTFKHPDWAIDVAKKLDMPIDVVGGTFVGDKTFCNSIIAQDNHDTIKVWPDVDHDKKIELMQTAKAVLFPSMMGEPFGLVPLEAMMCGTPVVALNDGAVEEIVADGVSGFVCDVFDKSGMNYKIKRDPIDAMVEAVRKIDTISPDDCRKQASKFTRKIMAQAYLDIYHKILTDKEW